MSFKEIKPLFLLMAILLVSCNKDEMDQSPEEATTTLEKQSQELSASELKKIGDLHLNTSDVRYESFTLPGGETESRILIEGDIAMTPQQLKEMKPLRIDSKQYRTYNLVSSPRTINVIGYTGTGYGQNLTTKQRNALQAAVNNYNALNIGLNFTLSFGTNISAYDIVVYQNPHGEAGGVAGFPSNGNPYKYVQIFSGMANYSTATNEHVITHEIGHTLGMRHTDWDTRASCGQSGESAGSDGAVHIPGTPYGYDSNSIMLACFGANEDGNFGYYDTVALDYLY